MRLGVAGFFIETFRGMAERKQKGGDEEATATEVGSFISLPHSPSLSVCLCLSLSVCLSQLINFMEKAKMGETLPNDAVLRFARMFKDELTLGNISRPQLVTMCQFMGLVPYGSDAFLRFQVTLPFLLRAMTD
jgi:LETM1 and EF-hand domain-containing protein 1, mitochondrial